LPRLPGIGSIVRHHPRSGSRAPHPSIEASLRSRTTRRAVWLSRFIQRVNSSQRLPFPSVRQVDLSLTREVLHSIVLRKDRLEIAKFQPRAYPATRALRSMNLVDTVRSVLKQKGQNIWSVSPEAWVYDAIEMMAEKHVGALLVISEGKLLGIISERDYARKVILQGKSSRQTRVKEIMTSPVI
jgi:CBS-domain-containing membrane protein